jgi:hypothetical protein
VDRERVAILSQRAIIVAAVLVCIVAGAWALVSGETGTEGLGLGLGVALAALGAHGLVFCRELVAAVGRARSRYSFGPVLHALMSGLIAASGVLLVLGALRERP